MLPENMNLKKTPIRLLYLWILLFISIAFPLLAQEIAEGEISWGGAEPDAVLTWDNIPPLEEIPEGVPPELATPLRCFATFREAMIRNTTGDPEALTDAAICLDLPEIDEDFPQEQADDLTWKLANILDNIEPFQPSTISDELTGSTFEVFSSEEGDIEIARSRAGIWQFNRATVNAIPDIHAWLSEQQELVEGELSTIFVVPDEYSSARACFDTYTSAMEQVVLGDAASIDNAIACLNIPEDMDQETSADIARKLSKILSTIEFDPAGIDVVEEGHAARVFPHSAGNIEIGQVPNGSWFFTTETVLAVPEIYASMESAGAFEIHSLEELEVGEGVPQELASPYRTYRTFTDAMERYDSGSTSALQDAVECLDLSQISGAAVKEYGDDVAKKLWAILKVIPKDFVDVLPDDPEGPRGLVYTHDSGTIEITKSEDGAWRISPGSVDLTPEIHAALVDAGMIGEGFSLRQYMPDSWKEKSFLGIENWQWLFLILIILLGLVIDRVVPLIVGKVLSVSLKMTFIGDNKELIYNTSRPFGFLAMSGFWWIVLGSSGLELKVLAMLLAAVKFMTAAGIVWCTYRAVDIISEFIERRARDTDSRVDDLLAPFVRKTLKVFVTVFGIVFVASNINIDVTSLIAGLGIGGLALALAAQDTLSNLFGSITVLFDRPFQVGDWIIVDDVEGTVEELGFRSTRIRTFYGSLVTVPNAKLISANVDNMGERQSRRLTATLSVTYETPPETIEAFCEGIREIIRVHPYTRKDVYHVWLNSFAASSLDILLYCYFITPDWATELREKHRLYLDIIRLARELNVDFAYPTEVHYRAEAKPMSPTFPASGTIQEQIDEIVAVAGNKARKISWSELGGKNKVPPPVSFDTRGSVDDDSDGDEANGSV